MRSRIRLTAFAAVGVALASCDEHDKTQSQAQSPPTPSDRLAQQLPASEGAFKRAIVARYLSDQAAYDAQPNNIAKQVFDRDAAQRLCQLIRSYATFSDWKAIVGGIDYFQGSVTFVLNIGNDFTLEEKDQRKFIANSEAYNVLYKLRDGDIVTVSGQILTDGNSGTCDHFPSWNLYQHQKGDSHFYVTITALNGASALPPPPSPPPPAPPADAATSSNEETESPETTPNQ